MSIIPIYRRITTVSRHERKTYETWTDDLLDGRRTILACGTCLKLRNSPGTELCPLSTMKDLHELIRDSDKLVSIEGEQGTIELTATGAAK